MSFGAFLLLTPLVIVVLMALFILYQYFTKYRHASEEEKERLHQKYIGTRPSYQLTANDYRRIETGEIKLVERKAAIPTKLLNNPKITKPTFTMLIVFVFFKLIEHFFTKPILQSAMRNCELVYGFSPYILHLIIGWVTILSFLVCTYWLVYNQQNKAMKEGYILDNYKQNRNFEIYKKVDDKVKRNFALKKLLIVFFLTVMAYGMSLNLSQKFESAHISNSIFNFSTWQQNSLILQKQCLIDAEKTKNKNNNK